MGARQFYMMRRPSIRERNGYVEAVSIAGLKVEMWYLVKNLEHHKL